MKQLFFFSPAVDSTNADTIAQVHIHFSQVLPNDIIYLIPYFISIRYYITHLSLHFGFLFSSKVPMTNDFPRDVLWLHENSKGD